MIIRRTTLGSTLVVATLVLALGAVASSAAVVLVVDQKPGFAANNGPMYLSYAAFPDGSSCGSYLTYEPCFVGNRSLAVIFNCASEAATPSGCTTKVVSPLKPEAAYQITIWYPVVGQPREISSENCKWITNGYSGPYFFYSTCLSINSTSFIVTQTPSP